MTKTPQGALAPADAASLEQLGRLKVGQEVWVDVVRARNTAFHRKWFALVGVGFDAWEPPVAQEGPFAGLQPIKSFDRFRKDLTIQAGYYEVFGTISGEARVEARSISFERMSQDEFERLYSATIDALLRLVLRDKTEGQLRAWVDAVLRFA